MNTLIHCQDELLEVIVTLTSVGTAGQTGRGVPQIIRQELYKSVMYFIISVSAALSCQWHLCCWALLSETQNDSNRNLSVGCHYEVVA